MSTFGNTSVPSGMFRNNKITSLNLGSNITTIGSNAFSGNQMSDITIPVSVRSIGNNAFKQTSSYPWNSVTIEYNDAVAEGRFFPIWTKIGWPLDLIPDFSYPEVTLVTNEPNDFEYQGYYSIAHVTTPGYYKLEVWGAQGGYRNSTTYSGKGGYSVGYINFTEATDLYIYVGGSGSEGGFNGGGVRDSYDGGGGASDIRVGTDSLYARVIVAGGGGSDGAQTKKGMYGGGLSGGSATESFGTVGYGGTISGNSGGTSYITTTVSDNTTSQAGAKSGFGFGGNGITYANGFGGAGGGGWYGGAGAYPDGSGDDDRGGGGGSGWIYTESNFNTWQSGNSTDAAKWLLDGKYYLSNADTLAGNTTFKSPTGTNETGHSGNGYIRITYVGSTLPA